MYGDAVFETMRVEPHIWLAAAHFRRLKSSLSALALPASALREAKHVADTRPVTKGPYALRLVVSRGQGSAPGGGLRPFSGFAIYATLRPVSPSRLAVVLRTSPVARQARFLPWQAKHACYLPSIYGLRGAPRYSELLWCDSRDRVLETGTGNLILLRDDTLITPASDDILAGTTRDALKATPRVITRRQLMNADAVWVTSAINIVRPVSRIDGRAIPVSKSLTEELLREYQKVACASPRST